MTKKRERERERERERKKKLTNIRVVTDTLCVGDERASIFRRFLVFARSSFW